MAEESSASTAAAAASAAAQEAARQIASEPGFSIAGCGGPSYTFEVCEPRQCGEGLGSFITYIVRSTSDLGSFSVTRRFSDFAWLREQLQRVYPGCVIMGLPPKTFKWTSNILADDFVQKRGRALQHFLEGTAQHAELRASSHFETFMQADADDLVAAKARTKASGGDGADGGAVGGEIGGAMGRLFGRLGRALSSTAAAPSSGGMLGGGGGEADGGADGGGGAGAAEGSAAGVAESAEAAAAGRAVYLFKRFAEELSVGAKLLQARAAALPGAGAATGAALTALAQAVGGVGLVEGGHVATAVGASHVQQALSQQAAHAGALGAEFAEGVERFVGLVAAVEEALRARDGAAEERALARSSRNRLRARAAGGDLVGPELDAAEAAAVHEESRFAKVQARALRDVAAFKEQYQPALKALLLQLLRAEEEALSERQELLRSVIGAVEGAQPSHPPPMQPASPRAAAAAAPSEEGGGAASAPAAPAGGGAIDFSLDSGPGL